MFDFASLINNVKNYPKITYRKNKEKLTGRIAPTKELFLITYLFYFQYFLAHMLSLLESYCRKII